MKIQFVADVCQGGIVRVAFNQEIDFEVDTENNTMLKYPVRESIIYGFSYHNEILSTFFNEHNLNPTFHDNNHTYSHWDKEAGEWTGAVAGE